MNCSYREVRCGFKISNFPKFQAEKYINFGALDIVLPTHYQPKFSGYWGMLGNNSVSDCVQAGTSHIVKEWAARNGKQVPFSSESAIETYSESTGYNGTMFTDQGTDITAFSEYWRTKGIIDANRSRHIITAYATIDHTNITKLKQALMTGFGVGLGYQLAADAEQQYETGEPWAETGSGNGDGHFIPLMGWNTHGNLLVVTWPTAPGQLQAVTPQYHLGRCLVAIVYYSREMLGPSGLSPDQFDEKTLEADLAQLGQVQGA